jgi:hypothetical protein
MEVDTTPTALALTATTTDWTLTATPADSTTGKLSSGDVPTFTYTAATGDFCVTVTPASPASAWSAGPNGLKKGTTCP